MGAQLAYGGSPGGGAAYGGPGAMNPTMPGPSGTMGPTAARNNRYRLARMGLLMGPYATA